MAQTTSSLKISVVVPVYNGHETLRRCLAAACNQTLDRSQYEVVVIDDGSTDDTPQIAAEFPVRLVRLEKNSGRIVARMRGAAEAACETLAFCDSRVILERDVLETVLKASRRPLMFGSDQPFEQMETLFGRFFFCLYAWLWKPYVPQEWYGPEFEITEGNFDRMPKGFTFFVTDRAFYLRHQPAQTGKHISDDTLILASMVRESPVVRYSPMRCHYLVRNDVRSSIKHIHWRGVLFDSYYLRPGQRYLTLYIAMWLALAAGVALAIAWPRSAWVLPAAIVAVWLGVASLWAGHVQVSYRRYAARQAQSSPPAGAPPQRVTWATTLANFGAILLCLPVVAISFGLGVLRSQGMALGRWWNRRGRKESNETAAGR